MPSKWHLTIASYADLPVIRMVFERSVRQTCSPDYSPEQIEAWVSRASDARWRELLDSDLRFMLLETKMAAVAGFSSVGRSGYIHSLFVDPECQGRGVGTVLLGAAVAYARSCGASLLTTEVSLTACPFFKKRGFEVAGRQTVCINGVEMANLRMEASLSALSQTVGKEYGFPTIINRKKP